jgi:hypothetical protein
VRRAHKNKKFSFLCFPQLEEGDEEEEEEEEEAAGARKWRGRGERRRPVAEERVSHDRRW